jgi:hypothetical protein
MCCDLPVISVSCQQKDLGLCTEAQVRKELLEQFEANCEGIFHREEVCPLWNTTIAECTFRDSNLDLKQKLIFDSSHFLLPQAEQLCLNLKGRFFVFE